MKLRTLKKFLKVYKPILEIRIPPIITMEEMQNLRQKLRTVVGDKYLIFMIPCNDFPVTLQMSLDKVSEKDLEEFRQTWLQMIGQTGEPIMIKNSYGTEPEMTPLSYCTIHSPFKLPLKVYQKKLKEIQRLVYDSVER